MISVDEFRLRRQKIEAMMGGNSVLILFAGIAKKKSYDQTFPFVVNRNFYYLTNIKQEGSILVITKTGGGVINEYLFISKYDELKEKWTGIRLNNDEAKKISGINNVMHTESFESQLAILFDPEKQALGKFENVYLDLEEENKIGNNLTPILYKKELEQKFPQLRFADIYKTICQLRSIKSAAEIEEFRAAINKTMIGLNNILSTLKPGLMEFQLSSLFYYTIQNFDHSELAFDTICAGGKNGVILHYPNASDKLQDKELVLLDLGSQNNMYCADISRTYPINGVFTDKQKLIYEIVLECNKKIIDIAKPGMTLIELNDFAKDYLAKRCVNAHLIQKEEDISKVYYHSVSHHIGLDVHDPWDRNEKLVAGNVISDEPGLYFKELGIGIRIEDDLLITNDGCYVLSNGIIKEIAEIEKAMKYKDIK